MPSSPPSPNPQPIPAAGAEVPPPPGAPPFPTPNPLRVRQTAELEDPAPGDLPDYDEADALLSDTRIVIPPEIILGTLHKGTKGILASASKAGKTWLLLDLAICVSKGIKYLNWETIAGKVMFVNFEIPRPFMRERIRVIKNKRGINGGLPNLYVWTLRGYNANFSTLLTKINEKLRGENFSMVVLDPIYKGMVGRDENAASAVGSLCHWIEGVAVETGAAVVYAHHFAKGNQANKEAVDRMSGSGVFARDADTIIIMTPHEHDDCSTVELTLRNFPHQEPFVVRWEYPLMEVAEDLDPDDLRGRGGRPAGNYEEPLLALIRAKPMRTTEWETASKYAHGTFQRAFKALKDSNSIVRNERDKKWSVVEESVTIECEVVDVRPSGPPPPPVGLAVVPEPARGNPVPEPQGSK